MITKNELKYLLSLKLRKNREKEQKYIVETRHLVEEAAKSGRIEKIYELDVNIDYPAMKKVLETDTITDVVAIVHMVKAKPVASRKILLLDKVQDPGNLGGLIRSAIGFGFQDIILGEGCCDIYNSKAIRSSQGAIFKANLISSNLLEMIPKLKQEKYAILGTTCKNGANLGDYPFHEAKNAIILGNEGNGISEEILRMTDMNLSIEMSKIESLNVLVAGSIAMYQLSMRKNAEKTVD